MPQGIKKHLKRLNAPSHWMLDKMGGVFAPRPTTGSHKLRECIPLILLLRNRLKYALNARETNAILQRRLVYVDGKVRTDKTYPTGFMDVISIPRSQDIFRLLYDPKGRFVLHRISLKERIFKLLKVVKRGTGKQNTPFIITHDGRKIRYPDPDIKVNDTVKFSLLTNKILKTAKFEVGNLCYVTGGHSRGRIGEILSREVHLADFDIIHIRDTTGEKFSTRIDNVFVIGRGHTSWITLPKGKGVRLSNIQDRKKKLRQSKKLGKQLKRNPNKPLKEFMKLKKLEGFRKRKGNKNRVIVQKEEKK